ncbi:MAG: hypothetical protein OIN88_05800 [Candidatus Methanoperedens sp.]|nr:hypothetical protein [Candidatus Methanoperedens sp.]MCZ7361386.1 hypothetical protein [Candidatus Methanoperedens sp.]
MKKPGLYKVADRHDMNITHWRLHGVKEAPTIINNERNYHERTAVT